MSDAQSLHAERMAKGEIEYKAKIIESNDKGWKDEFVLILISIPILILGYSIFTDDVDIRTKLDLFFEYFNMLKFSDKYGFSLFFDLDPFPVIILILLTFSEKHKKINSSTILLAFSKEQP